MGRGGGGRGEGEDDPAAVNTKVYSTHNCDINPESVLNHIYASFM